MDLEEADAAQIKAQLPGAEKKRFERAVGDIEKQLSPCTKNPRKIRAKFTPLQVGSTPLQSTFLREFSYLLKYNVPTNRHQD